MPPKRTKVGASSNTALSTAVATKFVNDTARTRFELDKGTRQAIPERGFGLISRGDLVVYAITARGWTRFCKQPTAAVIPIVREFCANAAEFKDGKSWVRGKFVHFDSVTLNEFFGIAPIDDSIFQDLWNDPDCDMLLETLCLPGSAWQRPSAYNHFPERSLTLNHSLWYGFLTRRMMPVLHTIDVQRERAIILYAIATGVPINVGKLLYSQMMISIHNGHVGLFFPHIITELCIRAGLEVAVDDEWLQPMRAIDDAYAKTKAAARASRKRTFTAGASSSGTSQTNMPPPQTTYPHMPPPPPQPRRRNLADRMDDLGAFAMHQNNYNEINSAHMQYMESMMQGMALHMGLDSSAFPPMPPPYPHTFTFPYSFPGSEGAGGVTPPDEEDDL